MATKTPHKAHVKNILRKALRTMRKKGWNQGSNYGLNGTVCAMGALQDIGHHWRTSEAGPLATEALYRALPKKYQNADGIAMRANNITVFNDVKGRHPRTVEKLFERAIASL